MTDPASKPAATKRRIFIALAGVAVAAALYLFLHTPYSYQAAGVPAPTEMSPRLTKLFSRTKAVCFGRYVLELPEEARFSLGAQQMPGEITTYENAAGKEAALVDGFRKKILKEERGSEFAALVPGPAPNSLLLRFFGSPYLKSVGAEGIRNFVTAGGHVFEFGWGSGDEESPNEIIEKSANIARGLRARDNAEVPKGPGVCINSGFIAETTGAFQEIFSAGVEFPSFPDVRFSVMSNKNASTAGANGVGIIARHNAAMRDQFVIFPLNAELSRLRIGEYIVNGWKGEEVLLRHNGKGGAILHEFMWEAIGKTGDLRHPAAIDINFDTGVDESGPYAVKGSLTDDEAVALWNKLLSGLRYRD